MISHHRHRDIGPACPADPGPRDHCDGAAALGCRFDADEAAWRPDPVGAA
ncbi:hypothetical protein [Rubrimonas cliftonensis]|uniref:Uncharacterized protein n=1 Tax=Rubrimonas cliftonensis TaxID=89524 RepID=A0A1H4CUS7_9RHOB|nr:hypothetical protein [Rubrimonas cliftonensis]SEA64078.1 hypothetical protein SAMN05444370_10844 [Rubrimonas cliftonensis]